MVISKLNLFTFFTLTLPLKIECFQQIHEEAGRCLGKLIQKNFLKNHTIVIVSDGSPKFFKFHPKDYLVMYFDINQLTFLNDKYNENFILHINNNTNINNFLKKFLTSNFFHQSTSPKGKFIVLSDSETKVLEIFKKFWYHDIMKLMVITKNVHIASPYWKKNSCGKKVEKIKSFSCASNLAFAKLPKKFHGCNFILGLINNMTELPYVGNASSDHPGLFINPIQTVSKILELNLSYTSEYFNHEYVKYGKTTIMEKRLYGRYIDAICAAPMRNTILSQVFDQTESILREKQYWAVAKPPLVSNILVITQIFKWSSWILIFCIGIFVTFLWNVICTIKTKTFYKRKNSLDVFTMSLGMSLVKVPKKLPLKVLMLFYMVYSVHIICYFQGGLSGVLTHPTRMQSVKTIDDLINSELKPMAFNITLGHIKKIDSPRAKILVSKMRPKNDNFKPSNNLNHILKYKDHAIPFYESSFLMYERYREFIDLTTPAYLEEMDGNYLMRKGHHLIEDINRILLYIQEAGLQIKWLVDIRKVSFSNDTESSNVVLQFDHLEGAFAFLTCGLGLAFVIFGVESLVGCFHRRKFDKIMK